MTMKRVARATHVAGNSSAGKAGKREGWLSRRSFLGAGAAAAASGAIAANALADDGCPLCSLESSPVQLASAQQRKSELQKMTSGEVPSLISSADEVWAMSQTHQLTTHTRAAWELHRSVIDAAIAGGWENAAHPWIPERQAFYRYPLAFGSYAIPSLVMIDEGEYDNAVDCLRKSIYLIKENAAWNDWTRNKYGTDAVSRYNIMYKGHLNLMYGLYQMMTGDDQFEAEYQAMTDIIVKEYDYNKSERGFIGVECEPDQYFYPCNSVGMMSLLIHDKVFGTDYEDKYVMPNLDFLKQTMTDEELHLPYFRWHPTHGNAENFVFGDWWTLGMIHALDPDYYQVAFDNSKDLFITDIYDGQACYTKAALMTDGISTDMEQRTWIFYLPFCCREFDDPQTWSKIETFFQMKYETAVADDGELRFHDNTDDETMMEAYFFLGDVHQGWRAILDYDWPSFVSRHA